MMKHLLLFSVAVLGLAPCALAETTCDQYTYSLCGPARDEASEEPARDDCADGWRIELATVNLKGKACEGKKDGAVAYSPDGRMKFVYGNFRQVAASAKISGESRDSKRPRDAASDTSRATPPARASTSLN